MCVGDLMYQAICEPCEWNAIADRENSAVDPERIVEGSKPLRRPTDHFQPRPALPRKHLPWVSATDRNEART